MERDKDEIRTLLDKNFPVLNDAVKQIISEEASLQFVPGGKLMTRTGNNLKNVVMVADGFMKVYREGDADGEIFLYYIEPGNACAMSLVCASRQETSEVMIKAMEDSKLILLPLASMEKLMKNYKSWYQFVIETYRARFDDLLNAFDSIAFKKLDERLLDYLYQQSEKTSSRTLNITHQQIADDLHSTREVISRLLKNMEQKGLLAINRNSLLLKKDILRA